MPPRQPPAPFPSHEALHRATVAAGFVRGLVSGLPGRGSGAFAVLHEAGVDAACLADDAARIPIEHYTRLYNAVAQRLGDEAFGLFSTRLAPGTFEFLCRGVLSSATLGEALDRASRFLAIVLPDLGVRVAAEADLATLEIFERRRLRRRRDDPRRVFAFEWLLRLLHGLACWLAGRALPLDAVEFPYPAPPHAAEYGRIYTGRASFGAHRLRAHFDARLLGLAVRRTEADLAAFLAGAPGRISMLYRPDREVARALREWLARNLHQVHGFEAAARELHLSPRTLHRRLAEEGTSFRAVLEGLRRDLALTRLARGEGNVGGTAAALGYSEPSAFFRAFQKWTGMAPSRYRQRHNPG